LLASGAIVHCGGESVSPREGNGAVSAASGGSDAGDAGEECGAGVAGENASYGTRAYATLRSTCRLDVKVNRRGAPVGIDYTIK
jgi:hypothetical protein